MINSCHSSFPIQQETAQLKEGRPEKTDYSKMRANKEEIDAAGDDYAERDRLEPGGAGTAVKQEPIKVSEEMILVLVVAGRSINSVMERICKNS